MASSFSIQNFDDSEIHHVQSVPIRAELHVDGSFKATFLEERGRTILFALIDGKIFYDAVLRIYHYYFKADGGEDLADIRRHISQLRNKSHSLVAKRV